MVELDTVSLGPTGTAVSEIAFGTWRFGKENEDGEVEIGEKRAHQLLDAYADAGGNFIDTADVYGGGKSEEWIGDWLADRDREDYVIASKIYWPTRPDDPNGRGLSRKHLRDSMGKILDRLGTDYVDLLYIHRWDDDTPAAEFMRTLDRFVRDGKVNYLGTSTLAPNAWKVTRANEIADREGLEPFTLAQPRYNLVDRETEYDYLEMCEAYDVGVCPWSPLAQGFLTGKYERDGGDPDTKAGVSERFREAYLTEENFAVLDEVRAVADDVDATPAQIALAWLQDHPQVAAPLVGARTVDQLEENLAAATVELTDDQFERLAEAKEAPQGF